MATQYVMELDQANERFVLRRIDTDTDADIASYPKVTISLADLFALSGAASVEAKFREFHWLDKDTCVEYKAFFLMTARVAV